MSRIRSNEGYANLWLRARWGGFAAILPAGFVRSVAAAWISFWATRWAALPAFRPWIGCEPWAGGRARFLTWTYGPFGVWGVTVTALVVPVAELSDVAPASSGGAG